MGFHFDVVRNEGGSPLGSNLAGRNHRMFVIGIIGIE
jgi:hypothetical protein